MMITTTNNDNHVAIITMIMGGPARGELQRSSLQRLAQVRPQGLAIVFCLYCVLFVYWLCVCVVQSCLKEHGLTTC